MRAFVGDCLDAASAAGAVYADARVVDTRQESISVRTGRVDAISSSASIGFGVRVLADGAWGFASSAEMTAEEAARVARQAVAIARASASVRGNPVQLAPVDAYEDSWAAECEIDPFSVSLEEKLALLFAADEALRAQEAVKVSRAHMDFVQTRKHFASTLGSYIEQRFTHSGAGIVAYALGDGEVLPRSYPNSHGGGWKQAGYEYVRNLDLAGNAPRVAEEATQLLTAEECPSEETTLIIDARQLALQVHESIGHPTELDRVLGDEAAFAGTSFIGLDDLGKLRYGSEHVTITADATIPGSLAHFAYDDEGVPAQRDTIVDRGTLTGFLSSRESAMSIGRSSNGCMRADGWNRIPLVRMNTVSIEPGEWSFDDLIADTDRGLYVETNNSWSIDDKRLNFQFATEIGWLIENGTLTRMVKRPNYTGITPRFWNACDAVCSREHWQVWGLANCGKGEPMQVAHVAHGVAPARFRGVQVGVGR